MSWLFGLFSGKDASPAPSQSTKPRDILSKFVSVDPNAQYTFDSKRDAPESEICRHSPGKEKDCIQLMMYATQLFEAMQERGFYCALPIDPTRTHMECRKAPGP